MSRDITYEYCRHGKKTWDGDDAHCAFTLEGKFIKDNWNCILLDKLRELGESNEVWSNDEHCTVIGFGAEDSRFAILSYYKHRGKTDGFWVVNSGVIREGTEADAQLIAEAFKK